MGCGSRRGSLEQLLRAEMEIEAGARGSKAVASAASLAAARDNLSTLLPAPPGGWGSTTQVENMTSSAEGSKGDGVPVDTLQLSMSGFSVSVGVI